MQNVTHLRKPGRQIQRKLLRALNGAVIGAAVGAFIGGGLGALSACVVDFSGARFFTAGDTWSNEWGLCAAMGVIPAVPAGFLLGTSVVVQDDRRRLLVGVIAGLLVGFVYAGLWSGALSLPPLVLGAIVISGLVGGLTLTLILTAIRRHWKWWTRWEEEPPRV